MEALGTSFQSHTTRLNTLFHFTSIIEMLGFVPRRLAEVGVSFPEFSLLGPLSSQHPVLLIEPLAAECEALRKTFPLAQVIECAIVERPGLQIMVNRGQTSHLLGVQQTVPLKPGPFPCVNVNGRAMHEVDPGDIDVLVIDAEGSERWVLEGLISRPRVLSIETHLAGTVHVNPYRGWIEEWCWHQGYSKIAEDVSDSLYVLVCPAGRPQKAPWILPTPEP